MTQRIEERAFNLASGPSSPPFWGGMVRMQLERVEEEQATFVRQLQEGDRDSGFRLAMREHMMMQGDAHFLLIATRHAAPRSWRRSRPGSRSGRAMRTAGTTT